MTEPREILVVEDEPGLRELIGDLLQTTGARVHLVASLAEADAFLARRAPDLVLSDVRLPDGDGLSWIERRRAAGHRGPVLVMTAYGTVDRAVRALRIGATDFLVKPFDNERLLGAVHAALAGQEELDEVELRAPTVGDTEAGRSLIGAHGGLADVVALLPRVAASDATVLVLGESGTGKELVARAIHRASARMDGPFVSLNCAAIPSTLLEAELFGFERGAFTGAHAQRRGHIEAASGGTLFLDEIGDMALEAQAKLLRVLQERAIVRVGGRDRVEVDVRVVAATHRDLVAAAAEGRFREDLMYRLDVVRIEPRPGRLLRHQALAAAPRAPAAPGRRRLGRPRGPRLAGQRARARELGRARRGHGTLRRRRPRARSRAPEPGAGVGRRGAAPLARALAGDARGRRARDGPPAPRGRA